MAPAHEHRPLPDPRRARQQRALHVALALNAGFLVVEAVAGWLTDSLALLADAGHMLGDVGALALAAGALGLAARPASARHTFGLARAEVLAALVNGVALVGIALAIVLAALRRLGAPPELDGGPVLVVGLLGLAVNAGSAWLLHRTGPRDLNLRGAFLHLLSDALGSVGAAVAGAALLLTGATWVDPAVSLGIAALIVVSTVALLREVVHVLLQGTPRELDLDEVAAAMHAEPAVDRVHHLHVWRLSSDSIALSAHVVAERVDTLHEAQMLGDRLKGVLERRFGIDHATLELECHDCREMTLVDPASLRHNPPA